MPCVSTHLPRSCSSTRGSWYWFHWPRMLKIVMLTRPGLAMGSMIWKKTRVCEAPSTMAASPTAVGSVRKKAARKNTVNGIE